MAPVTRAKASKPKEASVAIPAAPTKKAVDKPTTTKTREKSAAAARSSSPKVQKKSSPKKKGKGRKASPQTSPKPTSRPSPKASFKVPSKPKTKQASRSSKSPSNEPEQDDFPELTQAYGILHFLDQPRSASMPNSPQFLGGQVLRPDDDVLMTQLAHHMVNPPAWSRRPSNPLRRFGGVLPRGFEAASSPPPSSAARPALQDGEVRNGWTAAFNEAAGKSSTVGGVANDRRRRDARVKKRPSSVVRNIVRQVREQPVSSSPDVRRSARRTSGVVRGIVAQVESQPETRVSIRNAQVFKRPTVAHVRRERGQIHDELRDWVKRLRRARDDYDGVIVEIEGRMQILKAVNRMQAPLRRAALGRGH